MNGILKDKKADLRFFFFNLVFSYSLGNDEKCNLRNSLFFIIYWWITCFLSFSLYFLINFMFDKI